MGEILFPVQMVGSSRITHAPDAHLGGHGLEFAIAIYLTGQAVERMICQDQFDNIPA